MGHNVQPRGSRDPLAVTKFVTESLGEYGGVLYPLADLLSPAEHSEN